MTGSQLDPSAHAPWITTTAARFDAGIAGFPSLSVKLNRI
jgi:hypothetical protein